MMTTTIEHDSHTDRPDRPWRERFHGAARLAIAVLLGAIALHWLWQRLQTYAPGLPDIRYVDSFALLLALAVIAIVLRLAWRAAAGSTAAPRP